MSKNFQTPSTMGRGDPSQILPLGTSILALVRPVWPAHFWDASAAYAVCPFIYRVTATVVILQNNVSYSIYAFQLTLYVALPWSTGKCQ